MKNNQKGFTLIEVLIVASVIGILAAIALPQFSGYQIRAKNKAAQSDLRNLKTTLEAFHASHLQYPE